MPLNQFGAILTYAIQLESDLAHFYRQAAQANPAHAAEMTSRAEAADKRSGKLEQSRRQNVTEITLEPIDGLDEADYAVDFGTPTPANADVIEGVIQRFYQDITPKINVLETRQVLQRCLKEHTRLSSFGG